MSNPPAKRSRDSPTIKMRIPDGTKIDSIGTFSPVHRINGFPWRLHVCSSHSKGSHLDVSLYCDKSTESYLWECQGEAILTSTFAKSITVIERFKCTLDSWSGHNIFYFNAAIDMTCKQLEVEIMTDGDGERFRVKPTVDPQCARDVTLVVGKRRYFVNKKSLAAHSAFFNALFFGGYKESKQSEIEIKDVDPKNFGDMLDIFYEFERAPLISENTLSVRDDAVEMFLQLAERFDLKIVSDRAEGFLLRKFWMSKHERLRLADQYKLEFLKEDTIAMYRKRQDVEELWDSAEYDKISQKTLQILWKKSLNFRS